MPARKVPCDCLNWCGDDPWLKKGKSEPCAAAKFRAEQDAKMDDFCKRFEAAKIALMEKAKGHHGKKNKSLGS